MSKKSDKMDGGGMRFNAGKLRVDLVPADVIEELARVLGYACTQRVPPYPERNWERGMKWSDVVASLDRHLLDVKLGRKCDPSGTGLRSTALLLCNAVFLCAYDIRGMHHLDDLEPLVRAANRKRAASESNIKWVNSPEVSRMLVDLYTPRPKVRAYLKTAMAQSLSECSEIIRAQIADIKTKEKRKGGKADLKKSK